jgi:hypothetical protein
VQTTSSQEPTFLDGKTSFIASRRRSPRLPQAAAIFAMRACGSEETKTTLLMSDELLVKLQLFQHAFVAVVIRHCRLIHIRNCMRLISLLNLKERLSVF